VSQLLGAISAEARLELDRWTADFARVTGDMAKLDKDMADTKPAQPSIDTARLEQDKTRVAATMRQVRDTAEQPISPRLNLAVMQAGLGQLRGAVGAATSELGLLDGTAGRLAGMGLGAAAVGLLAKAAFDMGAAFDDAVDSIRVGTGATGAALGDLEQSFERVFTSIPTSMENASAAITILVQRLGLSGAALEGVATQVLELSRLTGTNLTANTQAAAQAFNAWGTEAGDMAGILDQVLVASQQTGVSVTTLLQQVTQNAAIFRQFGLGVTDAIAFLAKLDQQGIDSTAVATGLRTAYTKFIEAGQDPARGLQDLLDVLRDLPDEGEAAALAIEAFGQRAGPRLFDAIRTGKLEVADLTAQLQASGGAVGEAAADTEDGAERFQQAINRIVTGLKPGSEAVFSFATTTVSALELMGQATDIFLATWTAHLVTFMRTAREAAAVMQALTTGQGGGPGGGGGLSFDGGDAGLAERMDAAAAAMAEAEQAAADLGEAVVEAGTEGAKSVEELNATNRRLRGTFGETKEAAFNLAKALAAAGENQGAIQGLLEMAAQAAVLDRAIGGLTDKSLAAVIVALRNFADTTEDVEAAQRAMAQAEELAEGHMAAQAATAKAAADAEKERGRGEKGRRRD
jgi:TP901 family phage tail tape measure protein